MEKKEPAQTPPRFHGGPYGKSPAPLSKGLKGLGITRVPDPITDRSKWPDSRRERSVVLNPSRDGAGNPFHPKDFSRAQMGKADIKRHMDQVAKDPSFVREMDHIRTADRNVNFYYWHSWNNRRYCHYTDRWGSHWYGWAIGTGFFWTRYNAGYWWWYDPGFGRWCYWRDGWWWWNDPYHVNVVYVYTDGRYVSSDAATEQPPAEPSNVREYQSPDGTRQVRVVGPQEDAFLYDASAPAQFDPVYLASGVQEVKFSPAAGGKRPQVLVILRYGSFNLFDDRGNPDNGVEPSSPGGF